MGSKIKVEKWNDNVDGTLSVEAMERKLYNQGYNCKQYEFSPGTNFPDHTHDISKKDSVVTGQFQLNMYGETIVLNPGDIAEVPENTVHNAKVFGNKDVVFVGGTKRGHSET